MRISAFRRLLAAYVFNELAWAVGSLALSVLVYRRTGSAIGSTAYFLCSQFLPALLSPPVVARIDRRPPDRLLPLLYGTEAVLFGILAVLTSRFSLVPVLVVSALDGLVAIVARAMAVAARAQVLRPLDMLPEGNALSNTLFGICFMLGPLLGGAIVVAGGTVAALLVNCGFFAVMAALLATAGLPGATDAEGPSEGRLRAAIAYARNDRPLRALLLFQAVGFACYTISVPITVVYTQHTLHSGAGGYGAVLSTWGGGAIVGGLLMARFRRRSPVILLGASAVALAIGFGTMAVAPTLAVALVGAAIGGVGNGLEVGAASLAIQERTTDTWMALVVTLYQSISALAPGVGFLAGGLITQLAGSRTAFATAAIGSAALAVVAIVALQAAGVGRPAIAGDGDGAPGPDVDDPARASGETTSV